MKKNNGFSLARIGLPTVATLLLAAGQAQSASVAYVLDQSGSLPDGLGYVQVTISDGVDGAIDFVVETLDPLNAVASVKFGIQTFAFNLLPGSSASAAKVTNLPDHWTSTDKAQMDGFGLFDIKIRGNVSHRTDVLTFSIEGVDGDTPADYAVLSTGTAVNGHAFFAAKVAGFEFCIGEPDSKKAKGRCIKNAFVGGSSSTAPIPLPATAWLFATGVVGMLVQARRRR